MAQSQRTLAAYRAVYCDDPSGLAGYGNSLREARLDLEKQSARSGMRADDARAAIRGAGQDA